MATIENNSDNEIKQKVSQIVADQLIANEGNKITRALTVGLVNLLYTQLKESGVLKESAPKETAE